MKLIIKIRDLIRWCIRSLCADFLEDISRIQQFNLSTAEMHKKAFAPFKNKFNGRDIVIVACGPTAKDYKPIPNAIHIGVNHAIRLSSVQLDFLFIEDTNPTVMPEYNEYRPGTCIKFYGISGDYYPGAHWIPSESDTIAAGAIRYRTDNQVDKRIVQNSRFVYDIATQPLGDFGSVVFPAIQFALWTNPHRIYLVGCDCTDQGHFDNPNVKIGIKGAPPIVEVYKLLKDFASVFYPATEIISIRPVGLKGIFIDR